MPLHFPLVQFEFTHNIGPSEGRYVVRPALNGAGAGENGEGTALEHKQEWGEMIGANDVLIVGVQGVPTSKPRRLGRRQPRELSEARAPQEVPLTIVTVIKATESLADAGAADAFLDAVRDDAAEQSRWVEQALAMINRAVTAYRLCAADPYAGDLSSEDYRTVRIGHGSAQHVKSGGWAAAVELPQARAPRLSRTTRLMPVQGMSAVLAGHSRTLESEELVLRVRLDVEHGRGRAAAAGLRAALPLLGSELEAEFLEGTVRERFDRVMASRDAVAELADRAVTQAMTEADMKSLETLAEDAGALIDTWRYQPLGFTGP